jgi:hypothetical protein
LIRSFDDGGSGEGEAIGEIIEMNSAGESIRHCLTDCRRGGGR